MKLFLLRHAEAENTRPDADRRLTQNGRQSIDDLAAFLKKAAFLRFRRDGHGEDASWQLRDLLTPKLSADVPNTDL